MQDMSGKKVKGDKPRRRLARRSVLPVLLAEVAFTLLCLGVGSWVWHNDHEHRVEAYRQAQFDTFQLQARLLDQRLADQQQYLRQLGYATRRLFHGEGPPAAVAFSSPFPGMHSPSQPEANDVFSPADTGSEREANALARQVHRLEPLMSDLYQSDALIQRLYVVLPQGVAAVLPGSQGNGVSAVPNLETHWLGTGEVPPGMQLPWQATSENVSRPAIELNFNIFGTDRQALLGVTLDSDRLLRLMQAYVRASRDVWLVDTRGIPLTGNATAELPDDAGPRGIRPLDGAQQGEGLLAWVTLSTTGWRMVGRLPALPPSWPMSSLGWVVLFWAAGSLIVLALVQMQSHYRMQRWEGNMRVPMARMAHIRQRLEAEMPAWLPSAQEATSPGALLGHSSLARLEHSLDSLERASQRLAERPRLQALLDGLEVPVALSHEGVLVAVNAAFERLNGRPRGELQGMASELVILPEGDAESGQQVRVRDGSGHWRRLRLLRSTDGQGHELLLLLDDSDALHRLQQMTMARDRARQESQLKTRYLKLLRSELEALATQVRQGGVDVGNPTRERFWGLMEMLDSLSDSPQAELLKAGGQRSEASVKAVPPRVLIVDDGPVNTALAHNVLSRHGLEVDTAASGEEALALAGQHFYDLVFMDIFMPAPDGIETSRRWRERESRGDGRRSVLIALTANVSDAYREQFFTAGMDDYLAKPYRPQALIDMIQRWLPGTLPRPT